MRTETKKVLVIEDDSGYRNILVVIINQLGYRVAQAEPGRDGVETAINDCFDLIFVGLDYPYLKGIDAIVRFRNNSKTKHLPILVYPKWESDWITKLALSVGATEVLEEPFTVDAICAALYRHAPLDEALFGIIAA